jgi:imidazoleglycerol phosphate dehydratase HisB
MGLNAVATDAFAPRTSTISRKTNETDIKVSLVLDVPVGVDQVINIQTGIGFLDHVSTEKRKARLYLCC